MSNQETLHFKIGLSSSSDKKQPEFNVYVNGELLVHDHVKSKKHETEYFEFFTNVIEGDCTLTIELKNKSIYDTVIDNDGKITDDLLLNIDSIEIEEIDLGSLLWTASDYRPNYPQSYVTAMLAQGKELAPSVKNCVNLGWNGKWILPFQSPFYIWLLENI